LTITSQQAQRLHFPPHSRCSPLLQKCCLLLTANESYQRAEVDLYTLTGIAVSHSTLQRLVHRQEWADPQLPEPLQTLNLDGGMIRLRTPLGQPCEWREYKAIHAEAHSQMAFFKDNASLLAWVNAQPWADSVTCLGDGHEGIWSLFAQMGTPQQRQEVLDWFHLMENAHKVSATPEQQNQIRQLLWQGKVKEVMDYLAQQRCRGESAFRGYLRKHRSRIINYQAAQAAGRVVGSGAVESLVKQIGLRVKIAGAQWQASNVPKVLKHRCAYLNGAFAT